MFRARCSLCVAFVFLFVCVRALCAPFASCCLLCGVCCSLFVVVVVCCLLLWLLFVVCCLWPGVCYSLFVLVCCGLLWFVVVWCCLRLIVGVCWSSVLFVVAC